MRHDPSLMILQYLKAREESKEQHPCTDLVRFAHVTSASLAAFLLLQCPLN